MSIIVYSTPTCPYCKLAKNFLEKNNIEFEDVDVSIDQDRAREMVEKTNQMGVPVIDVDGEIMIGFDENALGKLIKK